MNVDFNFPYCEDVGKYEKLMKVGQGTFGEVHESTSQKYKRYSYTKENINGERKRRLPNHSFGEIRILQLLP